MRIALNIVYQPIEQCCGIARAIELFPFSPALLLHQYSHCEKIELSPSWERNKTCGIIPDDNVIDG